MHNPPRIHLNWEERGVCFGLCCIFFWYLIEHVYDIWTKLLLTSLRAQSQFSSSSPSGQSLELSQTASWRMHVSDLQVNSSTVHATLSTYLYIYIFILNNVIINYLHDNEWNRQNYSDGWNKFWKSFFLWTYICCCWLFTISYRLC